MRILVAHNRYQLAGGEDIVASEEVRMLADRGNTIELHVVDNDSITGVEARALTAIRSFYSKPSYNSLTQRIAAFRPDVLHVHNFFPTLSPSIYFAAADNRIPVVQTLHNYRLLCAGSYLFREGKTCEECLEKRSFLPGVKHACYRGSRVGSAVVGAVTSVHSALGTWKNRIDRYITLTQFSAQKLGEHLIPPDKIRIKPNFVRDQGIGSGKGGFVLFVGRLSPEKGLSTILSADQASTLPLPIHIAGDGPLVDEIVQAAARPGSRLTYLGRRMRDDIMNLMRSATALVVPSLWYEGFPMVMVEALSFGLPILCSRVGGLPEIVQENSSGLLFEPGNPTSLRAALEQLAAQPDLLPAMRQAARRRFEQHYTEHKNLAMLIDIYDEAIATKAAEGCAQ